MSSLGMLSFLGGGTPGLAEIGIILVVMLLVFGNRVPEIMRSLGKGLTQFKKGLHEAQNEITKEIDADPAPNDSKSDDPDKKPEA
jgi:sec-independent protein translocase protein TatA